MRREPPVRICEGLGVQFPRATRLVVFCESQEDAELVKDQILPIWLAERGLSLSAEKTHIVHLTEGFDFLGFNIRHYEMPRTTRTGFKLLIKPGKASVSRKRKELREIWLGMRGHSVLEIVWKLNPIIRGWANYFRTVVASRVFSKMDDWMFRRELRYAKRTHPGKSQSWRIAKYWGRLNKSKDDNWVFGDKHTGYHLLKFRWFRFSPHVLIKGTASPDNPQLREYWWKRQKVNLRQLSADEVDLVWAQDGVCPVCGESLFNGEELHRHHRTPRIAGGLDTFENRELVHLYCHQRRHADLGASQRKQFL